MSELRELSSRSDPDTLVTPLCRAPIDHPSAWKVADFKTPADYTIELVWGFPVKWLFWFMASSLFGAGRAVLRPVACDQVPGARGRGQGTETLA